MRRLLLVGLVLVVVIVLGVAQLVLPGIVASRLRDQLSRSGQVLSVRVSALPAIKLLWQHPDAVDIRMGRYRAPPASLRGRVEQAADLGRLTASARTVSAGLLTLHDATLVKRGNRLRGAARVSEADLRAAVPVLRSVVPVASAGGRLTLRGTASVLGLSATVNATVSAQDGKLVMAPDVPFGGLATVTLFSSPAIRVDGVSASPAPGGFAVRVSGTAR